MKKLNLWAAPAILLAAWTVATGFTLSQVAMVAPLLRSTGEAARRAAGPVEPVSQRDPLRPRAG